MLCTRTTEYLPKMHEKKVCVQSLFVSAPVIELQHEF